MSTESKLDQASAQFLSSGHGSLGMALRTVTIAHVKSASAKDHTDLDEHLMTKRNHHHFPNDKEYDEDGFVKPKPPRPILEKKPLLVNNNQEWPSLNMANLLFYGGYLPGLGMWCRLCKRAYLHLCNPQSLISHVAIFHLESAFFQCHSCHFKSKHKVIVAIHQESTHASTSFRKKKYILGYPAEDMVEVLMECFGRPIAVKEDSDGCLPNEGDQKSEKNEESESNVHLVHNDPVGIGLDQSILNNDHLPHSDISLPPFNLTISESIDASPLISTCWTKIIPHSIDGTLACSLCHASIGALTKWQVIQHALYHLGMHFYTCRLEQCKAHFSEKQEIEWHMRQHFPDVSCHVLPALYEDSTILHQAEIGEQMRMCFLPAQDYFGLNVMPPE